MFQRWSNELHEIARHAGLSLTLPAPDAGATGCRSGKHSSDFAALLDELTEVYRLEPEAAW
jgi:ring-1,2-phenylacetyl-CoA epoxidase subunit PaaC